MARDVTRASIRPGGGDVRRPETVAIDVTCRLQILIGQVGVFVAIDDLRGQARCTRALAFPLSRDGELAGDFLDRAVLEPRAEVDVPDHVIEVLNVFGWRLCDQPCAKLHAAGCGYCFPALDPLWFVPVIWFTERHIRLVVRRRRHRLTGLADVRDVLAPGPVPSIFLANTICLCFGHRRSHLGLGGASRVLVGDRLTARIDGLDPAHAPVALGCGLGDLDCAAELYALSPKRVRATLLFGRLDG